MVVEFISIWCWLTSQMALTVSIVQIYSEKKMSSQPRGLSSELHWCTIPLAIGNVYYSLFSQPQLAVALSRLFNITITVAGCRLVNYELQARQVMSQNPRLTFFVLSFKFVLGVTVPIYVLLTTMLILRDIKIYFCISQVFSATVQTIIIFLWLYNSPFLFYFHRHLIPEGSSAHQRLSQKLMRFLKGTGYVAVFLVGGTIFRVFQLRENCSNINASYLTSVDPTAINNIFFASCGNVLVYVALYLGWIPLDQLFPTPSEQAPGDLMGGTVLNERVHNVTPSLEMIT